jgi:hypothetical protein
MHHGDGRFTAVLDLETGFLFAFEVACKEARAVAIASLRSEGVLEPAWLQPQCSRLYDIVEDGSKMMKSLGTVERGAAEIRACYPEMRRKALSVIDEIRERCE